MKLLSLLLLFSTSALSSVTPPTSVCKGDSFEVKITYGTGNLIEKRPGFVHYGDTYSIEYKPSNNEIKSYEFSTPIDQSPINFTLGEIENEMEFNTPLSNCPEVSVSPDSTHSITAEFSLPNEEEFEAGISKVEETLKCSYWSNLCF